VEAEYSLFTRGLELELADITQEEKIGLLTYCPLKTGFLTGQFTGRNIMAQGSLDQSRIGAASQDRFNFSAMSASIDEMKNDPYFNDLMEVVKRISEKRNRTVAQVAIRWLLQRNFVTSVVIGASNVQQLEENMDVLNVKHRLTYKEMRELNHVSFREFPYPYGSNFVNYVHHFIHRTSCKKYMGIIQEPSTSGDTLHPLQPQEEEMRSTSEEESDSYEQAEEQEMEHKDELEREKFQKKPEVERVKHKRAGKKEKRVKSSDQFEKVPSDKDIKQQQQQQDKPIMPKQEKPIEHVQQEQMMTEPEELQKATDPTIKEKQQQPPIHERKPEKA